MATVPLRIEFNKSEVQELVSQVRAAKQIFVEFTKELRNSGVSADEARRVFQAYKMDSRAASEAIKEVYTETKKLNEQQRTNTQTMGQFNAQSRLIRFGLAEVMTVLNMFVSANEKISPVLREVSQGLTLVTQGIAAGSAFGPWGVAVGVATGLGVEFLRVLTMTTPEVERLHQVLQSFGQRNEASETLQEVMDWTKAEAEWALKAVANNAELAKALDEVVKDRQPPGWVKMMSDTLWALYDVSHLVRRGFLDVIGDPTGEVARENEANRLKDKTEEQNLLLEIQRTRWEQNRQTSSKYYTEAYQLQDRYNDNIKRAEKMQDQVTQRLGEAYRNNEENKIRAEQDAARRILEIITNTEERIIDIRSRADERLTELRLQYGKRIAEIDRQYALEKEEERQSDLESERQHQARLQDLIFSTTQSLISLDFNTHEQLRETKLRKDREDILRRALFQRGQIEQQYVNAYSRIEDEFNAEKRATERRRKLRDDEIKYRKQQEEQSLQDQLARIEKERDASIKAAEETRDKQISSIEEALDRQINSYNEGFEKYRNQVLESRDEFIKAEQEKQEEIKRTIALLRAQSDATRMSPSDIDRQPDRSLILDPTVKGLTSHAIGGTVPGPRMAPVPIIAHGGEKILPTSKSNAESTLTPQYVFINANGSIAPIVQDVIDQMRRAGVFKREIQIVMQTET